MSTLKHWIFSKNNNKKYKKQQYLKALKISFINRKKYSRTIKHTININKYKASSKIGLHQYQFKYLKSNININWLLNYFKIN